MTAGACGASSSDDEELRLCTDADGLAAGTAVSWRCSARLARFRARRVWRPRRRACETDDGAALALALTSCSADSRASDASARTDAVAFSNADGSIASAGRGRARGRGSSPLASPRTPKTTSDRRLRHRQHRQWAAQRSRGKTFPRRLLQAQLCWISLGAPGSGGQQQSKQLLAQALGLPANRRERVLHGQAPGEKAHEDATVIVILLPRQMLLHSDWPGAVARHKGPHCLATCSSTKKWHTVSAKATGGPRPAESYQ